MPDRMDPRPWAKAIALAVLAAGFFAAANILIEYWLVHRRSLTTVSLQLLLLVVRMAWVPPAVGAARAFRTARQGRLTDEQVRQLQESRRRLQVERVKRILDASERLEMAFQPVIDLRTGRMSHLEALARFRTDPYRPPDQWFEEAAGLGMGADLELLALRRALERIGEVSDHIGVAVNLSPSVVADPRAVELISHHDPARVVIEITEHAVVDEYEALREHLGSLRDIGARLAVDDVGAGYANLRHVVRLSPDVIKLDRVLVSGLDAESPLQGLISGLADYARHTGAALVAEGIETAAELATLRILGVTHGQGYFLARPANLLDIDQQGDWTEVISDTSDADRA
ncbi:MAG TPA: EAL domain-containing protein [Acidimicrobiales bacterium]|nr:EAL domain-containing protein [Acidimicrobiales bacterium]